MDAFTGKEQNRANVVPVMCQFEDGKGFKIKEGSKNQNIVYIKYRIQNVVRLLTFFSYWDILLKYER